MSVRPFVRTFLGIGSLVFFQIFALCQKIISSCRWQNQIFSFSFFLPRKLKKCAQSRPKISLFLLKKLIIIFFLNLVNNESVYYFLCYCKNTICMENVVHEIWAKMLLANQIAGFLNELYFQNKWIKQRIFYSLIQIHEILKVDLKDFQQAWAKIGVYTLVTVL